MSKQTIYFSGNETLDTIIEDNRKMEKDLFKIALENYIRQIEEKNIHNQGRQLFLFSSLLFGIIIIGLLIGYVYP